MHEGTIISITGNKLKMSHADGSADDTHTIANGCQVTLNDDKAVLGDLSPGDNVCVKGDPITSIAATR